MIITYSMPDLEECWIILLENDECHHLSSFFIISESAADYRNFRKKENQNTQSPYL